MTQLRRRLFPVSLYSSLFVDGLSSVNLFATDDLASRQASSNIFVPENILALVNTRNWILFPSDCRDNVAWKK